MNYHVEDVGRIILQVQSDLASIKSQLKQQSGGLNNNTNDVNHLAMEQLISKAENDLKAKADLVLNSFVNSDIKVLPTIGGPIQSNHSPRTGKSSSLPKPHPPLSFSAPATLIRNGSLGSEATKQLLAEKYGIPYTKPEDRITQERETKQMMASKRREMAAGKLAKNKVSNVLSGSRKMLPRKNRIDPAADLPELNEVDMKQGVLELLNRGFVPANIDLGPVFTYGPTAPVKQHQAAFHDWSEQFIKPVTQANPLGFSVANIRLDATKPIIPQHTIAKSAPTKPMPNGFKTLSLEFDGDELNNNGNNSSKDDNGNHNDENTDDLKQSLEKIRGYNELLDTYSLHQFIIRKGSVLSSTPEFQSFKRTYKYIWGSITTVIRGLENLMQRYAVALAYIDGQEVAKLAKNEFETPTLDAYLKCICNIDQVGALMQIPGRRYVGLEGTFAASIKIQAIFRGYRVNKLYKQHVRENQSAYKIQSAWHCYKEYKKTKAKLAKIQAQEEDEWNKMQEKFKMDWDHIKKHPRTELHIPSISREEHIRRNIPNYTLRQNAQISRIAVVKDSNVDVIYISPYTLVDDIRSYYNKLLEVGGVENASSRLRVIVPENADKYPEHFGLSTLLLYSSRSIRRIRQLLRARNAYIVPAVVGPDEKKLSILLKIPILCGNPEIAQVLTTKSGSKRIFTAADVNVPPGAHDIYEAEDAIRTLSKLIAANLDVPRWIFKIDDEFSARGIAYYDVSHLNVITELKAERDKYSVNDPTYWSRSDVQESARERILNNLSVSLKRNFVIACPEFFVDNWETFIAAFSKIGGVIEACPLDIKGTPSVEMFIEPSGIITPIATFEQCYSRPYVSCGASFPAVSVPHAALIGASKSVCEVLKQRGIIGYVSIDFVTFWDQVNEAQRLWAVDLKLSMSSLTASFTLFNFLMNGRYDENDGHYYVPKPQNKLSKSIQSTVSPIEEKRFYMINDYIYHPNLATIRYHSFFNLCRLKGVSFDLQQRLGTAFILLDSLTAGVLGMIAISRSRKDSIKAIFSALTFIKEQVGLNSLKAEFADEESNFKNILYSMKKLKEISEEEAGEKK